ncbi:SH3 domain-containing protein [Auriculariales sp. MPI-PUGE-AT-0066]|nr:SH3 domain-containing protein [Auriculariales sp. MPI-PUGE-AT-0066]
MSDDNDRDDMRSMASFDTMWSSPSNRSIVSPTWTPRQSVQLEDGLVQRLQIAEERSQHQAAELALSQESARRILEEERSKRADLELRYMELEERYQRAMPFVKSQQPGTDLVERDEIGRSAANNVARVLRVRATHNFDATEEGELGFHEGAIITVVNRDFKDWWRGTLGGRSGVFPTNYVEPLPVRVRGLHTFTPTEDGELGFVKGDIITVIDHKYKDWWLGRLGARSGVFPTNYVEPLPEPTSMDLLRSAEEEAAMFAQAADIELLHSMLLSFDPVRYNLTSDGPIAELYKSSVTLRPKIINLIDTYSQKRADLVALNESFVKARGLYERITEDSIARQEYNRPE